MVEEFSQIRKSLTTRWTQRGWRAVICYEFTNARARLASTLAAICSSMVPLHLCNISASNDREQHREQKAANKCCGATITHPGRRRVVVAKQKLQCISKRVADVRTKRGQ